VPGGDSRAEIQWESTTLRRLIGLSNGTNKVGPISTIKVEPGQGLPKPGDLVLT